MSGHDAFAAEHYAPRAADYLTSPTHSAGPDLDFIETTLAEALRQGRPPRVLDLGCGAGHVAFRAAPLAEQVTACDPTPAMLQTVARTALERGLSNIHTAQAAAEELPFAPGSFGWVLSRYSAHHWGSLPAGLREARRVLAPTGEAIFVDSLGEDQPLFDTHLQALELLRDPSHVRSYTLGEWTTALAEAGFAVRSVRTHRVPLAFAAWVARAHTSPVHVQALLALGRGAPKPVRAYFGMEDDGSFQLRVATIHVSAA